MKIPQIAKDKVYHIVAGFLCALVAVMVYEILTGVTSPTVGFLFTAWVGAMKEIAWDKAHKKGVADVYDFLATCAGGALYALPIYLKG